MITYVDNNSNLNTNRSEQNGCVYEELQKITNGVGMEKLEITETNQ